MSESLFHKLQLIELERLLSEVGDDPILAPQLKQRLDEAKQAAKRPSAGLFPADDVHPPRIAVFMRGGGVDGDHGIRATIASAALLQFEKMFMVQATHDERESAKNAGRLRRPKGAEYPELLFTGTPRGSFGLEFSPKTTNDGQMIELHAKSLERLTDAITAVATTEESEFASAITPILPGVLAPLKAFMKVLAAYQTEIRVANEHKTSVVLNVAAVQLAAARMERDIQQDDIEVRGVFRGLTLESGYFDLLPDNGGLITGTIADEVSEEELDRINGLTNQKCRATLQRTTITPVTGSPEARYVLLRAEQLPPRGRRSVMIEPQGPS